MPATSFEATMVPEIIQLVVPTVKWDDFISGAQVTLDRSITASLDSKRIPVCDLGSFIGSLAELRHAGSDPEVAVRDSLLLRDHISLTFLVACDREMEGSLLESGLHCLFTRSPAATAVAVLSGTLTQWHRAIQMNLVEESSFESRILFGKVYLYLSRQGLSAMWRGAKTELNDSSFILA